MAVEHIRTFNIKYFKCFKYLELDSINRVNLIGGKNNVGKTSLLEAIELLSKSRKTFDLLHQIQEMLKRRQDNRNQRYIELDFINEESQCTVLQSDFRRCEIRFEDNTYSERQTDLLGDEIEEQYDFFLVISVNGNEKRVPIDRILRDRVSPLMRRDHRSADSNINFIKSSKTDEHLISILYGALVDLNKEDFLNSSLSLFDSNLLSIKQRATEKGIILKIQIKGKDQPVLLSSLGDGVNRYIAILCAIWSSQNGILLIDEIENGIHYSNYYKLWKIIFSASEEANCQIFVTSHSKECIEAFAKAQIDHAVKIGTYFELYRSKKSNIVIASSRDSAQLNYALHHGGAIRGE